MSSIMLSDQTVSLIRQFHSHYPGIVSNTKGREERVHMWKKITVELNVQYNTTFTVEQFKKKVQNVQCKSRRKIRSGERNLSDAEMEYVRLFEQDHLIKVSTFYNGNSDGHVASRTSALAKNINANSLVGPTKFFDTTLNDLRANETDDANENHMAPNTSKAISAFRKPAASNFSLDVLLGNTKPSQTTHLQLGLEQKTNNLDGQAPAKPHAVHLSHFRPAESLLSFRLSSADNAKADDTPSLSTGPSATAKAMESRSISVDLSTLALSPGADHHWRYNMFEIQKTILEMQKTILAILEKQTATLEKQTATLEKQTATLEKQTATLEKQTATLEKLTAMLEDMKQQRKS